MDNNTLSPELLKQIEQEAGKAGLIRFNQLRQDTPFTRRDDFREGYEEGYIAGATEYAQKYEKAKFDFNVVSAAHKVVEAHLHLLQQEYEALLQWKKEAKLLLDPILDYGQSHRDIKLGSSITTFVLDRCKEYDKLKMQSELNYEVLVGEYKALKEKAEKMDDALCQIWLSSKPANEREMVSWIETAQRLAAEVASSYNSNNQNENNG